MQQSKDQLYELIKDLKTKEEFEKEIQERYQKHEQLFDKDTVALLLIDELGKNKQVISKIADLKPDSDHAVVGTVTNIHELRTFTRKNGTSGRVVNLDISDDTGICRLVLWDKDVDQIKNKDIKKGTKIKIINGYTKNGYSGLEINLGRWGLLETESHDTSEIKETEPDEIKGILIEKEATRAFFKDTGEFGFVTKIKIKDGQGEKHITIWDEKVKEIQKYKIGDMLVIKDITMKQNNGRTELHANGNCAIEQFK
jgi:replication factor A1